MNPHVGFLHPLRAGHPALVSDLIEEFRAIAVDALVLNLIGNPSNRQARACRRACSNAHVDGAQLAEMQQRVARLIDPLADQVRYYRLCPKDVEVIVFDGPGEVTADWKYGIV